MFDCPDAQIHRLSFLLKVPSAQGKGPGKETLEKKLFTNKVHIIDQDQISNSCLKLQLPSYIQQSK